MQTKFISRIIAKPILQKMLAQCRVAGLDVQKIPSGYRVIHRGKNFEVLRAMNGRRNYLCRFVENLFAS